MKNLKLIALVSAVAGALSLNAGVVDVTIAANVNTVVTSCASQRGAVSCSSKLEAKGVLEKGKPAGVTGEVLGSIGEFEKTSIPVTKANNIGDLKSEMSVQVENVIPGSPDVIAFKPTAGKLTGKTVYVAFKKVPKKAGTTQRFDKLDIYTRLADKSADQWFNAGEVIGGKDGLSPQAFTLATNGTLTTAEPNKADIVISDLL